MNPYRLGRYEILGELGRGAMGIVYRARDPIIDRVVALKTIDLALTGAALASFTERFFQEARSAGRLNHPNIVTIYDAGEAEGVAYIAMEFLEGTSLREILDHQPPLPVARILELAGHVAQGLAYAHENGVVHRDIKPANILVLRNRRPKITDFGIARLGEAGGVGSERAGSPKYMSPEQIRGDVTLDGRSDLFSLGTVLYEMLTGRQPFTGEDVSEIMRQVLDHTPPVPSAVDPHVPPEFDGVVMRMLAQRPENRFPTARSLFRELRRLEEKLIARGVDGAAPAGETRREPEPATPVRFPDDGDKTLVIGAGQGLTPKTWRRGAAIGAAALAIAAVVVIPLRLKFADADATATRGASQATRTPAADLHAFEQPTAAPAPAPKKPPEAAPAPSPKNPPAAARAARKAAEPAPARRAAPPVVQAAAAPVPQTGTLLLAVSPWGEVYVDGKRHGTAPPLSQLELPPGPHRIEIRNTALPSYRTDITLQAGRTSRLEHQFIE